MENSPSSEANRPSASHEMPHSLLNPKAHFWIHNSPSPVSILNHINSAQASQSHFLKIHFNTVLPTYSSAIHRSLNRILYATDKNNHATLRALPVLFPCNEKLSFVYGFYIHNVHRMHLFYKTVYETRNFIFMVFTHTHSLYKVRYF